MTIEAKKRRHTSKTSLFASLDALKDFVLWAKDQGVAKIRVGDVELEIAPLATAYALEAKLSEQALSTGTPVPRTEERDTSRTLVDDDAMTDKERDELLNWSAT
jgi:hypothetical protein